MNRSLKTLVLGAVAVAAALAGGVAQARNNNVYWSVDIAAPGYPVGVGASFSNAAPVYYAPPPVYVAPPPVYVAPPPVVYVPRPVYVQPRPVYYYGQPVYYGPRWKHHHHHDDDDD